MVTSHACALMHNCLNLRYILNIVLIKYYQWIHIIQPQMKHQWPEKWQCDRVPRSIVAGIHSQCSDKRRRFFQSYFNAKSTKSSTFGPGKARRAAAKFEATPADHVLCEWEGVYVCRPFYCSLEHHRAKSGHWAPALHQISARWIYIKSVWLFHVVLHALRTIWLST